MDPQELQKNIALYYSKLSPKLRGFFSDMKWLEVLKEIGEKYTLSEEKKETLGTETTLVLLGVVSPEEYPEILTKELALPRETIGKILTEIDTLLLNSIQGDLIDAFNANTNVKSVNDRLIKLPGEVQKIIVESNYQPTLYDIATANKLNIEQMGELEKCLIDLITGVTDSSKFEDSVKTSLRLPSDRVHALVNDINEKILKEIRKKMVEISDKPIKLPEVFGTNTENDKQILNSAGIEIIPDLPAVPSAQLMQAGKLELNSPLPEYPSGGGGQIPPSPSQGEGLGVRSFPPGASATPEVGNNTHPILAQKLSGFSSAPVVKTEHSLENISQPVITTPSSNIADKPKMDPYREIPE